jgi:hypothetical protein
MPSGALLTETGATLNWPFTALMQSGQVIGKTGSLLTETASLRNASLRLLAESGAALRRIFQPLSKSPLPLTSSLTHLSPGFAVGGRFRLPSDYHLNFLLFSPAPRR